MLRYISLVTLYQTLRAFNENKPSACMAFETRTLKEAFAVEDAELDSGEWALASAHRFTHKQLVAALCDADGFYRNHRSLFTMKEMLSVR